MFPLHREDNNKGVNGPKAESTAYSQCGHGEEGQSLDWITHPLGNVGRNTKSMTGNKVGQWIPNRAQLSSKIMGDLDANLTEFEQSQPSEEDREEAKPSPMFAQTTRIMKMCTVYL